MKAQGRYQPFFYPGATRQHWRRLRGGTHLISYACKRLFRRGEREGRRRMMHVRMSIVLAPG